jgi:hypothetical protein
MKDKSRMRDWEIFPQLTEDELQRLHDSIIWGDSEEGFDSGQKVLAWTGVVLVTLATFSIFRCI